MVKLKAGEKKKRLIIDVCKKLFYSKGYVNTTYDDICQKADIPPGTITYHFDGKRHIAAAIESELEMQNKVYIEKMCGERYTKTQLMVIENYHMWKRIFEDDNIRRFLLDVSTERVPTISAREPVEHFYRCVMDEHGIVIPQKELRMIVAAQLGMSDALLIAVSTDFDDYQYEEAAEFGIHFFLRQLDFDRATIDALIRECKPIFDSLPIDNRYYRNFAYDEKYLKVLD